MAGRRRPARAGDHDQHIDDIVHAANYGAGDGVTSYYSLVQRTVAMRWTSATQGGNTVGLMRSTAANQPRHAAPA
ncbi:MAG: hypothetical protein M1434_15275 [Chloroflexi bacterium]|nr:hypothetical protein [Chloroflexota bacterium]